MRHLQELGIDSFDASILQKTAPRSLTQRVSRIAFGDDLAGIRYLSKHGHDIENWALFEPFQILPLESQADSPRRSRPRTRASTVFVEVQGVNLWIPAMLLLFRLFGFLRTNMFPKRQY